MAAPLAAVAAVVAAVMVVPVLTRQDDDAPAAVGNRGEQVHKAPCRDFAAVMSGRPACVDGGTWMYASEWFMDTLPTDPAQMLERIRTFNEPWMRGTDSTVISYLGMFLTQHAVPAKIRATMFEALRLVPTIEITPGVPNLDGKLGVGFAVTEGDTRYELIVDPTNGRVIGNRNTVAKDGPAGTKGTVLGHTSVETKVVNGIGVVR